MRAPIVLTSNLNLRFSLLRAKKDVPRNTTVKVKIKIDKVDVVTITAPTTPAISQANSRASLHLPAYQRHSRGRLLLGGLALGL